MESKVNIISYLTAIGMILAATGCITANHHKNEDQMPTPAQTDIFPKGNPQPAEYFTGAAFLYPLLSRDKNNEFALGSVTFEHGARTLWHAHPRGQVLIVIEGEGIYQEKDKPALHLKKGDVVNIPENVAHWHGATSHSKFVHIAITNYKGDQNVVWLQPVSETEYQAANNFTITMNQQDQKEQYLTAQQQSIVGISGLTAAGDLEKLKVQLNTGLDSGLTVSEIKEILVQLYAYCGFPRSLNGITTLMAVVADRRGKGIFDAVGKEASQTLDSNKYETGKKTLQVLTGREEKVLTGANAFAPAIDIFLKEHLFADIFSRDVLNYQQRELVTVSALAAMSGVLPQLQAHIGMAMNTGLTRDQLQEAFTITSNTIGKIEGDLARSALDKVIVTPGQ